MGIARRSLVSLVLVLASAAAALAQASPGAGERAWMTVDEVRTALVGRPAAGIYPGGKAWAETMHATGRADYSEGTMARQGDWYFNADGELCFRYDNNWGGGCFRYVQIGPNCYEHYVQLSGRGEPLGTGPDTRFATNGKLWRTDEPATCEERPSV